MDRMDLKIVILACLEALPKHHSLKQQHSKAARFAIKIRSGDAAEIMFQKDEDSPPNIWVSSSRVQRLIGGPIDHSVSLASELWSKLGKGGKRLYGRHSALRQMAELGEADLICFAPHNLEEVGRIIDALIAA